MNTMVIHWAGIGEIKFAENGDQLGCILGSCVTVTLWHPGRRCAAMSHVLLPARPENRRGLVEERRAEPGRLDATDRRVMRDGRYAPESWLMLKACIAAQGIYLDQCEAHVAGGGRVIDGFENDIGTKNINAVLDLLTANGVTLKSMDVGGFGHRTAHFDTKTGQFKVKHTQEPSFRVHKKFPFTRVA